MTARGLRRLAVAVAVVGLGIVAVPCLFVLNIECSYRHRVAVVERYKALGGRAAGGDAGALAGLVDSLDEGSSFERTQAAAVIGGVGPAAAAATPELAKALEGPDLFLAREAALALGRVGPGASSAVPALLRSVARLPNADVGWFSAESLGLVADPGDPAVRAALTAALRSPVEQMRDSAAQGLAQLDNPDRPSFVPPARLDPTTRPLTRS